MCSGTRGICIQFSTIALSTFKKLWVQKVLRLGRTTLFSLCSCAFEGVAKAFGLKTEFHPELVQRITDWFHTTDMNSPEMKMAKVSGKYFFLFPPSQVWLWLKRWKLSLTHRLYKRIGGIVT